jgi:hypothetical protein
MTTTRIIGVLAGALLATGMAWAASPSDLCRAGKNDATGALATCRYKALARYGSTGNATRRDQDLARCATRFTQTMQRLEAKAEAVDWSCPSVGEAADVHDFVARYTDDVAASLDGAPLAGAPQGSRLRTGQNACWNQAGTQIACAGTGQDADVRAGLSRFFIDLGNGTILDTRTGLTWEKHSDDGSIHDMDDQYLWGDAFQKIATLNAIRFGGHDDWRMPNVNELYSLVSYETEYPTIPLDFRHACTPGCTVLTCSCSEDDGSTYWSSTTWAPDSRFVLIVWFSKGMIHVAQPGATIAVRAVRGGL